MELQNKGLFLILLVGLNYSVMAQNAIINPVVQVVSQDVSDLGEGPYYDPTEKVLYHVDATRGQFVRVDPETGTVQRTPTGGLVSVIIPIEGQPGNFLVSRWNELYKLNWATQQFELISTLTSNGQERFNDGKADPRGRLFIGTVQEKVGGGIEVGLGGLYRVDGTNFVKQSDGFDISNGMAWSNDANHTKFYFNDSEGRKIYRFNYDIETGALSNKTVMIDLAQDSDFAVDEYPDGMAIDNQGFIWVAMWNGGRVVKINPEEGKLIGEVKIPGAKTPSSLAAGPYKGADGFYVTTALNGISDENRLDDGKIHHISFQGGDVFSVKF